MQAEMIFYKIIRMYLLSITITITINRLLLLADPVY